MRGIGCRQGRAGWLLAAVLLLAAALPGRSQESPYDLLITGGRVMDPASGTDRVASVAVRGGKVVAVGEAAGAARRTIDARDLVVAPGFIDMLSGENPAGDRFKVADGVTTVISTHGGPVAVAAWYGEVSTRGAPLHYGTVVGDAGLRAAAGVTDRNAPATPEQVTKMTALAEGALAPGALGVGFGIEYIPGMSGEEVVTLAQVAARHRASVHAHIRLPHVYDPFQGINELIAASSVSGAPVQVVHIGSMTIDRMGPALALIDAARARGIDIAADVYPYDAWMAPIQSAIFDPGWQQKYALDYDDLVWPLTGERLTAESFAKYRQQGGSVVCHQIDEADVERALRHPAVSVASDGTVVAGRASHPRCAGTFARVLGRYVRERRVLPLMAALRKMTLMPAQRLEARAPALRSKGRVSPGMDADLTLFDPRTVADRATFDQPERTSAGIPFVIVAGTPVIDGGRFVEGARPGRGSVGLTEG